MPHSIADSLILISFCYAIINHEFIHSIFFYWFVKDVN